MAEVDSKKFCARCKRQRALSGFTKDKQQKDGYGVYCKSCRKWQRIHHWAYDEKAHRTSRLIREFSITVDEYDKMLFEQNGVCAICGKKETSKSKFGIKRLAVDHNHNTNTNRQLLCSNCNCGIGLFDVDNQGISLLLSAVEYIRKHNGN